MKDLTKVQDISFNGRIKIKTERRSQTSSETLELKRHIGGYYEPYYNHNSFMNLNEFIK